MPRRVSGPIPACGRSRRRSTIRTSSISSCGRRCDARPGSNGTRARGFIGCFSGSTGAWLIAGFRWRDLSGCWFSSGPSDSPALRGISTRAFCPTYRRISRTAATARRRVCLSATFSGFWGSIGCISPTCCEITSLIGYSLLRGFRLLSGWCCCSSLASGCVTAFG